MCGIAGIYRLNKQVNQVEIDKLTDSLSHRGPDGRGVWFNNQKNLGLGHRRLSILDLTAAGRQPMVSHDGKYVIVLNGEILIF
jgi:asparagine synthase (glutamine-hydrolysing)